MTNPWHDIHFGKNAPKEVQAIIEVPKDSRIKYELDKESGLMRLDRILYSAVHYPGDYGFIPQTYWEDGDPLDIIVLSNFPVYPKTIVTARPIGVIEMSDGTESDDKIIAVHSGDPRFNGVNDLKDVQDHLILEVRHFFETYKALQNQKVEIIKLANAKEAHECIKKGIALYREKFGTK
ncbi:MAG: inorganic diphosphatase [archaeon]|nr:inorganic diphosphatase [archaeon]